MERMRRCCDGAVLAGVCSRIARTLGWNVWAVRGLFAALLLIKTLWAIAIYAALALFFGLFDGADHRRRRTPGELRSAELDARNRRIRELERKFRELEDGAPDR